MLSRQESKALEHQAIIVALLKLCDPRAMDNFKTGDTVQLKSGGPVMTVTGKTGGGKLTCAWFENSESKRDIFPPESLKPADVPEEDGPMVG